MSRGEQTWAWNSVITILFELPAMSWWEQMPMYEPVLSSILLNVACVASHFHLMPVGNRIFREVCRECQDS